MADGLAEMRAVSGAHGQLGDLEIELDFAFQDHAASRTRPADSALSQAGRDIGGGFQPRLALAG